MHRQDGEGEWAAHRALDRRATAVERAGLYLSKMPVAVSGQSGHATTFRAASALVWGFDLDPEEALPLLMQWNQGCQPPWTERDLRHKLRSAKSTPHPNRERGHLLYQEREREPHHDRPRRAGHADAGQRKGQPFVSAGERGESRVEEKERGMRGGGGEALWRGSRKSENEPRRSEEEPEERRARLRATWPAFLPLRPAGIRTVARLRGLPEQAVADCARGGFLKGVRYGGADCFAIGDGSFVQLRRFDGQPIERIDGSRCKSYNLPGCQGAFLGHRWVMGNNTHVLLVEGAAGLLEAVAALELAVSGLGWSPLAATSASSRFARDPELLASLKGRLVRIIPDRDPAGLHACGVWWGELQAAGARVDVLMPPPQCKDLGEVVGDAGRQGEFFEQMGKAE